MKTIRTCSGCFFEFSEDLTAKYFDKNLVHSDIGDFPITSVCFSNCKTVFVQYKCQNKNL